MQQESDDEIDCEEHRQGWQWDDFEEGIGPDVGLGEDRHYPHYVGSGEDKNEHSRQHFAWVAMEYDDCFQKDEDGRNSVPAMVEV